MRKPASSPGDEKKIQFDIPYNLATELAANTVCLALALALVALASRIVSIW
jgi:hypothetical protein